MTPSRTPVVDTHHHFWQVARQEQAWRSHDHDAIARDYEPADLEPQLRAAGVDATVLVQSVDSADENDRLASYAASAPFVAGVVAWLPLQDPAAARRELDRVTDLPALRGVRCLVGREPLDWLAGPEVRAVVGTLVDRGLSWDVVPVTAEQVDAVVDLARAVPDLRVVVDHLARPPLDSGGWEPWAAYVRTLSSCPGVVMKVSVGIDALTSWEWSAEGLGRYVAHAVDCFGPDRLMLASNWPVVELRRDYAAAWSDLTAAVRGTGLAEDEVAAVLGGTAVSAYRLGALVSDA